MAPGKKPRRRKVRLSVTTTFKEGDVVVDLAMVDRFWIEKGILLIREGTWVVCFFDPELNCLDLCGTHPAVLTDFYRFATPKEKRDILLPMDEKTFGVHRGFHYFDRWQEKLEKVVKPAVEQAKGTFFEGEVVVRADLDTWRWTECGVVIHVDGQPDSIWSNHEQELPDGGIFGSEFHPELYPFRLATLTEQRSILVSMFGKPFMPHSSMGMDRETRAFYLPKYESVIKPLIEEAAKEVTDAPSTKA